MRLAVYGGVSSLLALGVILNAMHQRSNFYAACVYLSKSSACIMILLNMGLLLAICFGKTLQAIFFGALRAIEVEHLYERSWYAVTETCLAMTIFRQEFNLQFVFVFTTLLFLKIFHWLCQDRVEFMEQSPSNRVTFHVRMVNLMALLFIIDCVLARHAINITLTKGPNMMVMFGFEYTILICTIMSTIGKYILNVVDMRSEEPWEGKSMYVFYLDLLTDFLKLITYLIFFFFICYYYQLPIHIIRDVYVTFRSFIQKCRDLYRYRRATRNMNELYPNATADDFARMNDSTCIICREEMQVTPTGDNNDNNNDNNNNNQQQQQQNMDQPKKLPCGHIFHFHCLRSWLERQQSCPTCRRSVLADNNGNRSSPQQNGGQPQPQPQPPLFNPNNNNNNNNNNGGGGQDGFPMGQPLENNIHYPTTNTTTATTPVAQQQQPMHGVPYQQQQQQSFGILTPDQSSWVTSSAAGPGMIPLIPLSGGSIPSFSTSSTNGSNNINISNNSSQQSSLPESLTEEDLRILSTTTRDAMEQRLRILDTVQNQIFHSMQVLTQALSVFPVNDINNTTTNNDNNNNNDNTNTTPTTSPPSTTTNINDTSSPFMATSSSDTAPDSLIYDEMTTTDVTTPTTTLTSQQSKTVAPLLTPSSLSPSSTTVESSINNQGVSSSIEQQPYDNNDDDISSSRRRKGKMPEQVGSNFNNRYSVESDEEDNNDE